MRTYIALLICIISMPSIAASAKKNLQYKLEHLKSIQATFKQNVYKGRRILQRTSGTLAMKRPGRFRWTTKKPINQLVIADGKRLYVYDKDLNQVTVQALSKGIGGSPALFFIAYRPSVLNDFSVSEKKRGVRQIYTIKPKKRKSSFQSLRLTFQGLKITGIHLLDNLGQVTSMKLRNIRVNPTLSQAWFYFKAPKGADVIYR